MQNVLRGELLVLAQLQPQQHSDGLQVVFNPMVHFLHQRGMHQLRFFQRGGGQFGDKAKQLFFILGENVPRFGLHVDRADDFIAADQRGGHQRGVAAFAGAEDAVKTGVGKGVGYGDGFPVLGGPAG